MSLIDTPGACRVMEAERRGIAQAIAAKPAGHAAASRVPLVSVVIGEGGSGGAAEIAVSDRMAMFEHSIFSVISPEGCVAILWKTSSSRPKEAAAALKLRCPRTSVIQDSSTKSFPNRSAGHRDHAAAAPPHYAEIPGALSLWTN